MHTLISSSHQLTGTQIWPPALPATTRERERWRHWGSARAASMQRR